MSDLPIASLARLLADNMRPYIVRGELEGGGIGAGTHWSTPERATPEVAGRCSLFTRVLEVLPVERGSQDARLMGVPAWFFFALEGMDRASNGGPPLDDHEKAY